MCDVTGQALQCNVRPCCDCVLTQHSAKLGRAKRLALRDHELVQIVWYQVGSDGVTTRESPFADFGWLTLHCIVRASQ